MPVSLIGNMSGSQPIFLSGPLNMVDNSSNNQQQVRTSFSISVTRSISISITTNIILSIKSAMKSYNYNPHPYGTIIC